MGNSPKGRKTREQQKVEAEARRAREEAYFGLRIQDATGVQVVCPWHLHSLEHPLGAPKCVPHPEDLETRILNIGQLMAWMAMMVTELGREYPKILEALTLVGNQASDAIRQVRGIESKIYGKPGG